MSCQECTDDPWQNLSSEIADRDRNINIVNFVQRPPLGWDYRAVGCQRTCVSEDSQLEADLCALAQAQECLFSDWSPPRTPGTPFQPPPLYTNSAQICIIQCSNGQEVSVGGEGTFSWTIPAGTVVQLSQAEADIAAHSLACLQARRHRICISSTLAGGCIDQPYKQRIVATGGTPAYWPFLGFIMPSGCQADETAGDRGSFSPIPYTWSLVSGSLPPGLELRACTGYIKGTPTTAGIYSFTVKAVDAIGSFQQRTFTLSILEISTPSTLPNASINNSYLQNLLTNIGNQESQTWTVVAGALPTGLSLTSAGILSGTPTGPSLSHTFTAQVVDTSLGLTCSKQFTITVDEEIFYRIVGFDPNAFDPGLSGCVTTAGTGQPVWDGTFRAQATATSFYVSQTVSIMTLQGFQVLTSNGDGINRCGLRLNGVWNLIVAMQNGNTIWHGQKAGDITGVYNNAAFGCSALPASLTIEEI